MVVCICVVVLYTKKMICVYILKFSESLFLAVWFTVCVLYNKDNLTPADLKV